MKLKTFKAKNVFGYLDFDINFNEDLTLLYGINGSGKTTALKLIQAILTPSFKDFHIIKYDELKLSYIDNNKTIRIEIKKSSSDIDFNVYISNKKQYELNIPTIKKDELEYIIEKDESYFNEFLIENRENDVIDFLTNIKQPLFLGLDRRNENNEDIDYERNILKRKIIIDSHGRKRTVIRRNKYIKGSLGISLMESELLVQDAYRRIRMQEDIQRDKLRNELLLTSFNYIDLDTVSFSELKKPNYLANIISRKSEIIQNISNLGTNSEELINKTNSFFEKLQELKEKSEKKKNEDEAFIDIELITNKVQIDRMEKLLKTIDEHKSIVDKHFEPINKFLTIINRFFESSGKNIEIDTVGHIKIKKPNGKYDSIEALSSGERQLIIIFIHLIFEKRGSKVFIIDEPELSLHIHWQSIFTESVIEISPKTQFILATHSPEIIAGFENKTSSVR
jgi:predicted ATP-binding protein involved in virulence